ncbi:MAG: DeoR/GlpR family DNA-binding transcription regulator [Cobetia marina]
MNNQSAARLDRLQAILREGSPLQLSDAAQLCGVSEMTIRRDVTHSNGLLEILGGRLLLAESSASSVYRLDREIDASAPIKQALCQRLASHIEDGDTLYVDCGTTLVHLAAALDRQMTLTLVTCALNVANAVGHLPGVRLVMLGGLFHPATQSFTATDMPESIRRLGINKAFLSAGGVHAERGVSCFHFHEVAAKQAALESAMQRFLIIDARKFEMVRPAFIAPLESFDVVISNASAAARDCLEGLDADMGVTAQLIEC